MNFEKTPTLSLVKRTQYENTVVFFLAKTELKYFETNLKLNIERFSGKAFLSK